MAYSQKNCNPIKLHSYLHQIVTQTLKCVQSNFYNKMYFTDGKIHFNYKTQNALENELKHKLQNKFNIF